MPTWSSLKCSKIYFTHKLITTLLLIFSAHVISVWSFKKDRFSGLYIFKHIYGMQIHFSEVGAQTLNWWEQSCSHWAPPDSSHSSCFLSRPNRTLRTGCELGHSSRRCWELKLCHRRHGGKKNKTHQSGSSSMLQQPQGPAQPSLAFSHTTILHVSPQFHGSWGWRKSNVVLTSVDAVRSMRSALLSVSF